MGYVIQNKRGLALAHRILRTEAKSPPPRDLCRMALSLPDQSVPGASGAWRRRRLVCRRCKEESEVPRSPPARAGDHILSLDPSLENPHTCTITTEEIFREISEHFFHFLPSTHKPDPSFHASISPQVGLFFPP